MNIFQSNKPARMKPMSKQFLANIVLSVLVCYLIVAVEQLHAGRCSDEMLAHATKPYHSSLPGTDRAPSSHHNQPSTSVLAPLEQQQQQQQQQQQPPPPPPPPQQQQQQQQQSEQPKNPSEAIPQHSERTDAVARRRRPHPSCVDGSRAKTFLMVFMGHSGSSAIASELRVHPQVHMENAEMVDHQEVFNTTEALLETRAFFERGIADGKTAGFKIRPAHILEQPERWAALAEEYDTRIIWQYRKNLFKAAVGEYSNRYLNDTSVVEGLRTKMSKEERCKIGAGCSYKIEDMKFLWNVLRNMIRSQHQIVDAVHKIAARKTDCVRELPYEDYLYEREETLEDLFKFLGLKHEQTEPLRFKATDDNLCNVVENWNDVCNKFYGCTLYQHMMDDPRNGCYCPFSSGSTDFCKMSG